MKRNTTYLCGGINGLSDADCKDWRETAKEMLHTATLDPMSRDYRGREDECVNEIVEGDKEDIRNSNFLLVNVTRPSWGTAMEIPYAWGLDIPIIAFCLDPKVRISPWLRYHCTSIWPSVEVACNEINRFNQI
jgi:hypothetical protein